MKRYPILIKGVILTVLLCIGLSGCAPSVAVSPTNTPTPTQQESEILTSSKQPKNAPKALVDSLAKNNLTIEDLSNKNCKQIVVVNGSGTQATISFFVLQKGNWMENKALFCNGFVGKNGISSNKTEGDGCTPMGLYAIGRAFYIGETAPKTKLESFQITKNSYWVDDPNSKFYNQYVTNQKHKDWKSAEHMIDYPGYQYGFVIEYNTAREKHKGSAIFFHVGNSYTAGCVATNEFMVLAYLCVLDSSQSPYILLTQS